MIYRLFLIVITYQLAGNCLAQVSPKQLGDANLLPPMMLSQEVPSPRTMMFHDQSVRLAEQPIRCLKMQAIQKISFIEGILYPTSGLDLSNGFLETAIGLGVPLGSFDNILGVSPSFRVDWMDTQTGLDVPSELHDTRVSFFYAGR